MILLHQPPPAWGLPSISPFCVKLETYLRMTKLDYKATSRGLLKAPKGRVPYITDGSHVMGDSGLIIDYLKAKYGDPLDAKLSPGDRARGLAIRRLVEDHLYFAVGWLRWSDENSWAFVAEYFRPFFPRLAAGFILRRMRGNFLKTFTSQGIGQHSREEVIALAKADFAALSVLLGEQPYFLGTEPTSVDATLYGFLVQVLGVPWESPAKDCVKSHANLVAYCDRMKARYWAPTAPFA